jgi:hypothetical protein
MVANTYSYMLVYYFKCNSKSRMGADMAELIRDRDDKNQIRWKVIRSDGKVIIITTNEDVADTYYQKELEREHLASV